MEYATEGSLFHLVRKARYLTEDDAFYFFIQSCAGIYFMHSHNLLHRDIKPENLLITRSGMLKICDFGWCTDQTKAPRKTFCGTLEYMAPEIIGRKEYGEGIDIWCLGVLLFEMLNGRSPFRGRNDNETFTNIQQCKYKCRRLVSTQAKDLIAQILQVDPKKRIKLVDIFNHPWVHKFREKYGIESETPGRYSLDEIEEGKEEEIPPDYVDISEEIPLDNFNIESGEKVEIIAQALEGKGIKPKQSISPPRQHKEKTSFQIQKLLDEEDYAPQSEEESGDNVSNSNHKTSAENQNTYSLSTSAEKGGIPEKALHFEGDGKITGNSSRGGVAEFTDEDLLDIESTKNSQADYDIHKVLERLGGQNCPDDDDGYSSDAFEKERQRYLLQIDSLFDNIETDFKQQHHLDRKPFCIYIYIYILVEAMEMENENIRQKMEVPAEFENQTRSRKV